MEEDQEEEVLVEDGKWTLLNKAITIIGIILLILLIIVPLIPIQTCKGMINGIKYDCHVKAISIIDILNR